MDHSQAFPSSFPPPFDLTGDLVKLYDQYLNGGGFGDVYKCQYNGISGAKTVAVKALRFTFNDEGGGLDKGYRMLRRELGIWRRLDHKNIVPFLGVAYGYGMHGAMSLVSLWMPNGTLESLLKKHGESFAVVHRLQLLFDIASGLEYLHCPAVSGISTPVIHGDLNPNNVLIDANYNARLTDFGFASFVGEIPEALAYLQGSTARPGALRWIAPEQISMDSEGKRSIKSDIYSFGNITLQVLTSKRPWSEVREDSAIVLLLYQGCKPGRPERQPIDDHHWAFINLCWSPAEERPEAGVLVSMLQQFLDNYPDSQPLSDLLTSTPIQPVQISDGGAPPSAVGFSASAEQRHNMSGSLAVETESSELKIDESRRSNRVASSRNSKYPVPPPPEQMGRRKVLFGYYILEQHIRQLVDAWCDAKDFEKPDDCLDSLTAGMISYFRTRKVTVCFGRALVPSDIEVDPEILSKYIGPEGELYLVTLPLEGRGPLKREVKYLNELFDQKPRWWHAFWSIDDVRIK